MKSRELIIAIVLLTACASASEITQENTVNKPKHHHYKLIDIGTFGGPASSINFPFFAGTLNNRGMTVGWSATSVPTLPTSSFLICGGLDAVVPFITHAFFWDGAVKDLGAFPPSETNCSEPFFMNSKGEVVGASETGQVDPQFFGLQQIHAVFWKDGRIIDLGTLGGNQVAAFGINNRGQIVGNSTNAIPDPFCFFGTVQNRLFLWEHGQMRDLGTLGGNCAAPGGIVPINERGQVIGNSTTTPVPNPLTSVPTTDPLLWEEGRGMTDLGTLGGAFGFASAINNDGQIVGQSSIPSDPGACNGFPDNNNLNCHAFLWEKGALLDLTTSSVGGNPGWIAGINDAGEIIGWGVFPTSQVEAFLWRDGVATDLGNLSGCGSFSQSINSESQIVGAAFSCDGTTIRAFLWERGSIVDLNTLIPPDSGLELAVARDINDRGEIVGDGVPPGASTGNFNDVAFLLIPCDENHPNIEGCDYSLVDEATAAAQSGRTEITQAPAANVVKLSPTEMMTRLGFLRAGRHRSFGMPQTATKTALNTLAALAASATLLPTSLTFSTQAIGTTSAANAITLRNTGTASLTITAIAITGTNGGDFAHTQTCGSSLAAGASCSISVTFKPTASGTRTAALSVTDNAAGSPQKVPLSGIGTTAKLSPTSLTFSTRAIGTASAAAIVTLTNVGATTFTISGISITGINAADFAQTQSCGSSLAVGASCSINVTFKPTASGTRTAALSVSDNAAGSPQLVPLSGIGTTAKLSPASLHFGEVTIGTTSLAKTVTLTNVGATTLTITGITITGTNAGDFAQTHTCASSLAAGASCIISVTFKPAATGLRTAALSLSDNAFGSPQTVALSGGCIPFGGLCFGPGPNNCCPAPHGHHSFCSDPTGWGTCIEN